MDLRDLKYFEVIATEGNLGRAAERLHRTQPALTKCIDRLEEAIGTRLFAKDGRGMRLTAAGHILLRRTRQLTIMVDESAREIQDYAAGLQGEVRLGCVPTVAQYLMPAVFEQLLAEAPEVSVKLAVATNDSLLASLRDAEIDLVIGPMIDTGPDFECEQIAEDTVVVMAREDHPIFGSPCTLADLLEYKWMLPAATVATRQWLDQTFERNGLARPHVQIESNVLTLTLQILEKTPLLGFVTRYNLVGGRANVREVAVPETHMKRRLGLTYRRNGYLSPVATRVADILRERGKDLLSV
ncbi:LysR family transcriptional regulator [Pseudoduganella sp. UC29_106]|uniref:LysR family transcriptional regulator n=1 Tax=Pseudoduganella sp. UC29_106 TaxID=3374553 RepID=UPI0037565328